MAAPWPRWCAGCSCWMTPTPSTAPTSPSPPGRRSTPSARTSRSPRSWPGCTACSAPRRRYRAGRAGGCQRGAEPRTGSRGRHREQSPAPGAEPRTGNRARRAAPSPEGRRQPNLRARPRAAPPVPEPPPALSLARQCRHLPEPWGEAPGGGGGFPLLLSCLPKTPSRAAPASALAAVAQRFPQEKKSLIKAKPKSGIKYSVPVLGQRCPGIRDTAG